MTSWESKDPPPPMPPSPANKALLKHHWQIGYELDDEPNLYIGNGWKSPFPSIHF